MARRNVLDEIQRLHDRDEFANGFYSRDRLTSLLSFTQSNKELSRESSNEICKYFPIATVAYLESFSRTAVQLLVDYGGPYFDNLGNLFRRLNLKMDFEIVANLHKKQFTIGEFVSHLISCNNLSDLNNNLSDILGIDFFTFIQNYSPVWQSPEPQPPIGDDFESIKKSLARSFELRHIYCHESGSKTDASEQEMVTNMKSAVRFLDYAADFVGSRVYKHWGGPMDMVNLLANDRREKEETLPARLEEIKNRRAAMRDFPEEYLERFEETIEYWKKYSESKARLKSTYSPSAT